MSDQKSKASELTGKKINKAGDESPAQNDLDMIKGIIAESRGLNMGYDSLIGTNEGHKDQPEFDPARFAEDYDFKIDKSQRSGELVTTNPSLREDASEELRNNILRSCGLDPEQCRIVGRVSISSSRWTSGQYKNRAQRYRYQIEFINPMAESLAEEIEELANYKFANPEKSRKGNDKVLNLILADMQLGKSDNGGTEGIVERIATSLAEFKRRIEVEKPAAVVLHFAGDCVEGTSSQSGKNLGWQTHLTITEQIRVLRRIYQVTVKMLAPVSPELHLIGVGGNHDEAMRQPINSKAGDNWAVECMIAAEDSVNEASALTDGMYDHVKFHYPAPNRSYVTVKVRKSTFLVAHGHQWKRGKSIDWWKQHAFSMQPGAMANFLIHGHEHEAYIRCTGGGVPAHKGANHGASLARTVICGKSSEGASDWFDDFSPGVAGVATPGGTYFVTEGTTWRDYSIF